MMETLWQHMNKDEPEGHNCQDWPSAKNFKDVTGESHRNAHKRDHRENPDIFAHTHKELNVNPDSVRMISDPEIDKADDVGAKLTIVATVSFAGDTRLVSVKTAIPFVEREIKNVLNSVGMDSFVSVSVNFNV
jgi:hypothetical protein